MNWDCPFGIRVLRIKYEMSWGERWEDVQREGLAEKIEQLKVGALQLIPKKWHFSICPGSCCALLPLCTCGRWGTLCTEWKSPRNSKANYFKGIDEECVY